MAKKTEKENNDSNKQSDRELFTTIKEKSDDDYEKNITFISSGTLVLSLTFIEKIVSLNKSEVIWSLIACWIFLVMTLLANLVSHQLSSLYHERTINDYDNNDKDLSDNVNRRNRTIRIFNWSTTFGVFLGISFLIYFCSINAIKMSELKKSINSDDSTYIEKGRTIHIPSTRNTNVSPIITPTQQSTSEQTKPKKSSQQ